VLSTSVVVAGLKAQSLEDALAGLFEVPGFPDEVESLLPNGLPTKVDLHVLRITRK
jgi:hypothetical protein